MSNDPEIRAVSRSLSEFETLRVLSKIFVSKSLVLTNVVPKLVHYMETQRVFPIISAGRLQNGAARTTFGRVVRPTGFSPKLATSSGGSTHIQIHFD